MQSTLPNPGIDTRKHYAEPHHPSRLEISIEQGEQRDQQAVQLLQPKL